ncbi:zinc finger protein 556-like [Pollicipes pollicipes]|uniref:zinc finger protein 556-like n=1 Tax=Pollicipes pollicipes TaxID=41117 RepID=UPI001884F180|nr:zinc finger protein 556-like [Pollicipes pollicipes]
MIHGPGERCRHCDVVFRDFAEYYRHLADAHGVRKFVCPNCGAGFARKVMLNKHLVKEARHMRRAKIVERLQALQCSVCEFRPPVKRLGRESSVRARIRDHEHRAHGLHGALPKVESAAPEGVAEAQGERYACDVCGAVYGCRRALGIHKRVHRERIENFARGFV